MVDVCVVNEMAPECVTTMFCSSGSGWRLLYRGNSVDWELVEGDGALVARISDINMLWSSDVVESRLNQLVDVVHDFVYGCGVAASWMEFVGELIVRTSGGVHVCGPVRVPLRSVYDDEIARCLVSGGEFLDVLMDDYVRADTMYLRSLFIVVS